MKMNGYKTIATFCFCSMMFTTNLFAEGTENLYAGGSGTKSDPYLIETPAQFDAVRENRQAYFKLMADLDFASYEKEGGWWPLAEWGSGDGSDARFGGTFNGNGHKISNLLAKHGNDTGAHDMSIFGVVDGGTIKNLLLENITVVGGGRMGILSGMTRNANIEQIGIMNSSCSNIGTGSNAGGLAGPCEGTTTITNCYTADCNIKAESPHEAGAEWTGDAVGGLVSSGNATVMYCYSTSVIEGKTNVGGIIGANDGATVNSCLSLNKNIVGEVEVTHRVVGKRNGGDVSDNYALATVQINGVTVTEGTGLSSDNGETVETLSKAFYEDDLGWDFDEIWKLDTSISPYPIFKWQTTGGTGINNMQKATEYGISSTVDGISVQGLSGNETICIYSADGMLVTQKVADNTTESIALQNKRMYIIQIVSDNQTQSFKIAK